MGESVVGDGGDCVDLLFGGGLGAAAVVSGYACKWFLFQYMETSLCILALRSAILMMKRLAKSQLRTHHDWRHHHLVVGSMVPALWAWWEVLVQGLCEDDQRGRGARGENHRR